MPSDIILRAEVGSRAYGTGTSDSDRDIMAVAVEPAEFITGLSPAWGTMHDSSTGNNIRSTADTIDTTIYGLKKFGTLAVQGNPSVLCFLFANEFEVATGSGILLLENRDYFVSKQAGERFLGYMRAQRESMTGVRNKRTNRPELVHTYGYDTKSAYHMVRLGLMGYELMCTGAMTLPMVPENVALCMDIRNGKLTKDEVLDLSYDVESRLEAAVESADLPEQSDMTEASKLLHDIYLTAWDER